MEETTEFHSMYLLQNEFLHDQAFKAENLVLLSIIV